MNLNTAVIYGSARRDRQGIKAARFIVRALDQAYCLDKALAVIHGRQAEVGSDRLANVSEAFAAAQ